MKDKRWLADLNGVFDYVPGGPSGNQTYATCKLCTYKVLVSASTPWNSEYEIIDMHIQTEHEAKWIELSLEGRVVET